MVSVDISLTPSLPGATLSLSGGQNKRILDDFMGLCFFGRLRLRGKEGVARIRESTYRRKKKRVRYGPCSVVPHVGCRNRFELAHRL